MYLQALASLIINGTAAFKVSFCPEHYCYCTTAEYGLEQSGRLKALVLFSLTLAFEKSPCPRGSWIIWVGGTRGWGNGWGSRDRAREQEEEKEEEDEEEEEEGEAHLVMDSGDSRLG